MILQLSDGSSIARMLDLIERRAPQMMRAGGGALSQETVPEITTPETAAKICELAADGSRSYAELARLSGSTPGRVRSVLINRGVAAPDGRKIRHAKKQAKEMAVQS